MATPRPPQLDTGTKWASPAASIRSLSALLEVNKGVGGAGGLWEGAQAQRAAPSPQHRCRASRRRHLPAAVHRRMTAARRWPLPSPAGPQAARLLLRRQQARGAEQQSMLAAKESEAALLRQQLQQLTSDFKFNLKVCSLQGKREHVALLAMRGRHSWPLQLAQSRRHLQA